MNVSIGFKEGKGEHRQLEKLWTPTKLARERWERIAQRADSRRWVQLG